MQSCKHIQHGNRFYVAFSIEGCELTNSTICFDSTIRSMVMEANVNRKRPWEETTLQQPEDENPPSGFGPSQRASATLRGNTEYGNLQESPPFSRVERYSDPSRQSRIVHFTPQSAVDELHQHRESHRRSSMGTPAPGKHAWLGLETLNVHSMPISPSKSYIGGALPRNLPQTTDNLEAVAITRQPPSNTRELESSPSPPREQGGCCLSTCSGPSCSSLRVVLRELASELVVLNSRVSATTGSQQVDEVKA